MTKYHITSKGEPGLCKAKAGNCPLGSASDHYSTKAEAQEAFEKKQGEHLLQSVSKTTVTPAQKKEFSALVETDDITYTSDGYPYGNGDAFFQKMENDEAFRAEVLKSAEAAGIDTATYEVYTFLSTDSTGYHEIMQSHLSESADDELLNDLGVTSDEEKARVYDLIDEGLTEENSSQANRLHDKLAKKMASEDRGDDDRQFRMGTFMGKEIFISAEKPW